MSKPSPKPTGRKKSTDFETDKVPSHIEVFCDRRDGSFWFKSAGRYSKKNKAALQTHLITMGLREDNKCHNGISELEWPFWNAEFGDVKKQIDYAGPLAGHRVGVLGDSAGQRYLVTEEAAEGVWADYPKKIYDPKFFWPFVVELLGDEQAVHFCYWLAEALLSLRIGDFRPGQAVILAGDVQCGKSLLQDIITEVLGGRVANPFKYLFGVTQFNSDLVRAEHWKMEDPKTSTDPRTRREFGQMLKEAVINRQFQIHAKGKDALFLPVFRRISLSVNRETENLSVCPPLDPSIQDKVCLYDCTTVERTLAPYKVGTPALKGFDAQGVGKVDRQALWEDVLEEIPLVRGWLLKSFASVPSNLSDARFGVKAFHHPELFAELSGLDPWERMLGLIDLVCFNDAKSPIWSGKAIDLEQELRGSKYAFEVEKCLRYSGACGSYLGRLAKSHPDRITKRKVDGGYTRWTIIAPKEEPKTEEKNGSAS